jgi:hypothetical protein
LNFWNPSQTGLHSHYCDFVSTILLGQFVNTRYVAVPDPCGPLKRYSVERLLNRDFIIRGHERMNAGPSPGEHYGPGDTYSMLASELHISTAVTLGITLMRKDLQTSAPESFLTDAANTVYTDEVVPKTRIPQNAEQVAECWTRIEGFMVLLQQENK